jgi:hypothetical protein
VAEAGGPAAFSGAVLCPLEGAGGMFTASDLEAALRPPGDRYTPRSRLVSVEQTTNIAGGHVWPLDQVREVVDVAREAGYTGSGYRLVDLSAERVPFDYGSVLGESQTGRTWRDAAFRISFGKAKTQWQCLFTGALANLYGCLPEPDKLASYHGTGHEFQECCVLLADRLPVHFGLVDAWVGGDGRGSHAHARRARDTGTLLAGENLLAVDWVLGEKMGVDPGLSFVLQEALLRWGRVDVVRRGNTTPWEPWDNVPGGKAASACLLEPALRTPAARGAMRALGSRGRRLAAWTIQ